MKLRIKSALALACTSALVSFLILGMAQVSTAVGYGEAGEASEQLKATPVLAVPVLYRERHAKRRGAICEPYLHGLGEFQRQHGWGKPAAKKRQLERISMSAMHRD